jgi:hypothetical protein
MVTCVAANGTAELPRARSTLVRDLDDLDEGARILTRRRAVRIQDCGRLAALWARDGDWRPRILVGCISLQHRKRVHRGAGSVLRLDGPLCSA